MSTNRQEQQFYDRQHLRPVNYEIGKGTQPSACIAIGPYTVNHSLFSNFLVYPGTVAVLVCGSKCFTPFLPGRVNTRAVPVEGGGSRRRCDVIVVNTGQQTITVKFTSEKVAFAGPEDARQASHHWVDFCATIKYEVVDPIAVLRENSPVLHLWDAIARRMIDAAARTRLQDMRAGENGESLLTDMINGSTMVKALGFKVASVSIPAPTVEAPESREQADATLYSPGDDRHFWDNRSQ